MDVLLNDVLLNLKPLVAATTILNQNEVEALETILFTAVTLNSNSEIAHILVLVNIMLEIYEAAPCDRYAVRFAVIRALIPWREQVSFVPKPLPLCAAEQFEHFVDQGHILRLLATSPGDLLEGQSAHAKRICKAVVRRHLVEQSKKPGLPLQPWAKAYVAVLDRVVGRDMAFEIVAFVGYFKQNETIDALLAALHGCHMF